MFSNVLKSERALVMSIRIIEIFVKLREVLLSNKDILLKVERQERKVVTNDVDIKLMFEYIKELLDTKTEPMRKIDFRQSKCRSSIKLNAVF